jgi:hypothetical protein
MKQLFYAFFFSFLTISTFAQDADSYPADVLHSYFGFQIELIKVTPGFTPPVASRSLGYSGLFAYEAVVNGYPDKISLAGLVPQLNTLPQPEAEAIFWPEVVNRVLYNATAAFYSNMSEDNFDALEALRTSHSDAHLLQADANSYNAAVDYAELLSVALLTYANGDDQSECQFSNFPNDYTPPVGPGIWTPLSGQAALQPYWGNKRCFVTEFVSDDLIAPAPPEFSSEFGSELYEQAMAVYNASMELTDEQIIIAQYWADGGGSATPPGHSISMLKQIMELEESNLAFAAEAYGRLGMGLADAFVQCWKTKYIFNLERPITYIQNYIDPEWTTIVETPPFPEYTSGHSSQSGAFGEIMTALFGDNYVFTDNTYGDLFGGPRTFNSFVECAEETAISRLYGGIHYPIGNTAGSESGIIIGEMIDHLFEQTSLSSGAEIAEAKFGLYPNPSAGEVRIEGNFDQSDRLSLFDVAGRLVFEHQYQPSIDLTSLPAGVYVLTLTAQNGDNRQSTRLLLQ